MNLTDNESYEKFEVKRSIKVSVKQNSTNKNIKGKQ